MPLIRLENISLNFGSHSLLDGVDLQIRKGQRIGLLGRNGAGKSTLMKLIAGVIQPDGGSRWQRPGTQVAWLEQNLPDADEQSVYDCVADGLPEVGELLKRYHHLVTDEAALDLDVLEAVQTELEAKGGWQLGQKVDTVISQLSLPAEKLMRELSGGWRKRVALARALVRAPDVLLLDEPTNHLDIPAIEWLEETLRDYNGALVLVTHDRSFLERVVNQIAEIDRGHLYAFEGSYERFLRFREEQLAAEEAANKRFDQKLAEEEVWIRQGIKARRTRNEGRVRALEAMRRERSQRREQQGRATFSVNQGDRSGKIVAELDHVTQRFGEQVVIRDFSCVIQRGDRVGIVGANGAGKSTLLKIILGQLTPTEGTVKTGTNLSVAYFDQLREHLDPEKNLIDNVCGGQEFIDINGKRKHAISYLQDFLFTPDRTRTPAKALSGGEQNRAILAKIFAKPANVLILDEPTNDLDIETLELLEDLLLSFEGTVLLVSHDRRFMDNVVTNLLVFEGKGRIGESVGGYTHWVEHGGRLESFASGGHPAKSAANSGKATGGDTGVPLKPPAPAAVVKPAAKLGGKDKKALDKALQTIERLEGQQQQLEAEMAVPGFYQQDKAKVDAVVAQLASVQSALEAAYAQWEALEGS